MVPANLTDEELVARASMVRGKSPLIDALAARLERYIDATIDEDNLVCPVCEARLHFNESTQPPTLKAV